MRPIQPVIGIALLVSAALSACDSSCENVLVANVVSPNGNLKAVVFSRNCGATTGFNTQISIAQASDAHPQEAGDTFIADGTLALKIQWLSESELSVSGTRGAKV